MGSFMNETLQHIGKKLKISKNEIEKVKSARSNSRKGKLRWILDGILSAIAFVVGFFTGRSTQPISQGGYPFATGLTLTASTNSSYHQRGIRILLITFPIIAFVFGLMIGMLAEPAPYPNTILYGVYGREGNIKDANTLSIL